MIKAPLTILLAGPRGFCAGVERAVQIVERSLDRFGAPVYVRHEIVHNRFVVEALERKGAIFVEELDEVPAGAPVVFSAHGVPKRVPAEAERRHLVYVDATCPLVSKVHREAEHHFARGRRIILIGHDGHPEVIGTMGQLPAGAVLLVETPADVAALALPADEPVAYVTQTTLSIADAQTVVEALQRRFPGIHGPKRDDICYATTNRQRAVKAIAPRADRLWVVGAPNSSNSLRLVEVARQSGCARAALIARADDIDWRFLAGAERLGLTAGASAPEALVEEVVEACRERFEVAIEEVEVTREEVRFNLPRALSVA
ncbi:MAG TPA: 4-hydroxy-3-methylbut-2-enyl diphosphate reductase [Stellaceae bacterium]|nr:4-hydroxy-3-methylbut-2-enyl diphosphate reductase [Stellaceae bacterium]